MNETHHISEITEDLCKRILAAQEQMLKDNIHHNTVVLNGNKYGYLKRPGYTPILFGMKVETENMPEEYDFMLMNKLEPYIFRSNADKIRSMSDEELAEELWAWNQTCCYKWKEDKVLEWLKQEAE